MLRGYEGYGAHSFVHTDRFLDTADNEERIRAFLPQFDELITEGVVISVVASVGAALLANTASHATPG